ncbi:aminotransferase class V-fold PLP-dependent enzyme [Nocardiopsis algeriensis]|uniref:Kynureninase n=1 Tax=Nocardiopsis algeriensis TaxID=1478215 RepID=A0A841IR29_9ACTN|nr:aminotransferase class V-fold PLP-dependent enzyme [Nocardiopsis algeriensis]MBB6120572.1 kynureninase [Nocardiopsis algeriensis]
MREGLDEAERRDIQDPLSECIHEFFTGGLVHLNGNSLGPPRAGLLDELGRVVDGQWAPRQVQGWFADGWLDLPRTVGDAIGELLGARPGQTVVAGETTSTTLFNAVTAACRLREDRPVLLIEAGAFPTDLYVARSVARLLGRRLLVEPTAGFDEALRTRGSQIAAAIAAPVDFRTGELREIGPTTALCRAAGAVSVWDLSHAAGVLPTDVDDNRVDLAVGCGYKYLGGGPGAPAYLYAAERLHSAVDLPLSGWHGHAAPFEMSPDFVPAKGIDRARTGTPPLLGLVALHHALGPLTRAGIEALSRRSRSLSDFFLACVGERSPGLLARLVSPRDASRRGGHLALSVPDAAKVEHELAERGLLLDSRPPDLIRIAFAPLYVSHVQVWHAARELVHVLEGSR